MTAKSAPVNYPGLLVCSIVAVISIAGCGNEFPDAPIWDNPIDPLNLHIVYVLQTPSLGAILATTGSRQVTIEVLKIDPMAAFILMERKNGDAGVFVQIGMSNASEQGYVDLVPDSLGPVLYYRARVKTSDGALSPYSPAVHFTMP